MPRAKTKVLALLRHHAPVEEKYACKYARTPKPCHHCGSTNAAECGTIREQVTCYSSVPLAFPISLTFVSCPHESWWLAFQPGSSTPDQSSNLHKHHITINGTAGFRLWLSSLSDMSCTLLRIYQRVKDDDHSMGQWFSVLMSLLPYKSTRRRCSQAEESKRFLRCNKLGKSAKTTRCRWCTYR